MASVLQIVITITLGAALALVLPWWSVAIAAFLVAIPFTGKGLSAFGSGFAAIGLLWGGYALAIGLQTDFILSAKMAQLFKVGSPLLLVALTAALGGLIGGLSSLTGYYLKALFQE